jgi:hypothetical protein
MYRKALALLRFLAAERTENDGEINKLLSVENLAKVAEREGISSNEVSQRIYKTFQGFGYEHAKGEFGVMFFD